ncbi:MAG TPA: hypothetical protein VF636_03785 [Sphingomonas sp.]|jgi:hypothetical protein
MPEVDAPAALIASRLVKAGHQDEFERWADRLLAAVRRSPGHSSTARLDQIGGLTHFVHLFDGRDAIERWTGSAERRGLIGEAEDFTVGVREIVDGPEIRSRLPSESATPKWKLWIATWSTVFPLLLTLNAIMTALPFEMPEPVQLALTSLIMTAVLTWFVIPQLRKLLRPWLLGDEDGALRRDAG